MAKSKQTDAQLKTAMIEIWTKMDRLVAKLPPSRNLDELTDNELDDYRDVLERDREKYDDTYQLFGERYENVKEKKELFDGDDRNWENIDGAHDKFESIAGEIGLTIKRIETKKKQRREAIELEKEQRRVAIELEKEQRRVAIELEEKREEKERRRKREDDEDARRREEHELRLGAIRNQQKNDEDLKSREADARVRVYKESLEKPIEGGQKQLRLKDVSVPKFDGDYKKWQEFWDVFESLVHSKNAPAIDKFNILRESVIGEAAHYVKNYKFEAANYEPAIANLKKMYDQPEYIELSIREELSKVSPAQYYSQIVPTYQKIQGLYEKLRQLGCNVDAEFVSTIFMKLPPSFKKEIEVQKRIDRIEKWTKENLENAINILIQSSTMHRPYNNDTSRWNRNEKYDRPFDNGKNERRFESEKKTVETKYQRGANSTTMLASSDKKKPNCIYCSKLHYSDECEKYTTVDERKSKLNDNCHICLAKHRTTECRLQYKCYYCGAVNEHHRSLCPKKYGEEKKKEDKTTSFVAVEAKHQQRNGSETSLLMTGQAQLFGSYYGKKSIRVNVLLDTASSKSYIRRHVADRLHAKKIRDDRLTVQTFESERTIQAEVVKVYLERKNGTKYGFEALVRDEITKPISQSVAGIQEIMNKYGALELSNQSLGERGSFEIDVLIGIGDFNALVVKLWEPVSGLPNIRIWDTEIGTVVGGRLPLSDGNGGAIATAMLIAEIGTTHQQRTLSELRDLYEWDQIGKTEDDDYGDQRALDGFEKTVKFEEGRYQVTFPWIDDQLKPKRNRQQAVRRLESAVKRLGQDDVLMKKYEDIIDDQRKKNIIEEVPKDDQYRTDRPIHYLPHHPVITPQKTTTKVRIVFDGSAGRPSLNTCLYRGPVILEDVPKLLINFRMKKIAIIADIEKAFLQVGLQEADRDVTRFLWLKDKKKPISDNNIVEYRFARVPFGVNSSPFLLAATIRHHLRAVNTETARKTERGLYVDNVIVGVDTDDEAIRYRCEAKNIFDRAAMNLREWTTNSARLRETIPEDDRNNDIEVKVLGVPWRPGEDSIRPTVPRIASDEVTKRSVLSFVHQNYDPLGLFSPAYVKIKTLLHRLAQQTIGWDEDVDEETKNDYNRMKEEIIGSPPIEIGRWIGINWTGTNAIQLHVFADASDKFYAATAYIRSEGRGGVQTALLMTKNRVAPARSKTIPRLELMAVQLGTELLNYVAKSINVNIQRQLVWSDSQCVLYWLQSEKQLTTFVANRVERVKRTEKAEFRYVPTAENPADLATRGKTFQELHRSELWWRGPPWLDKDESMWPRDIVRGSNEDTDLEIKRDSRIVHTMDDVEQNLLVSVEERDSFDPADESDWTKFLEKTATHGRLDEIERPPTVGEMNRAETYWMRREQSKYYGDQLTELIKAKKDVYMGNIRLKLDADGVIRCHGRIGNADVSEDTKEPILLPRESEVTRMIIDDVHRRHHHAGTETVIGQLRQRYWVPRIRSIIKRRIKLCETCVRFGAGPFKAPEMPDLPMGRVRMTRPFSFTGVDYAGPIETDGGKRWICLFTCGTTRAIHLEMVPDMKTSSFLNALRRFIGRRGTPNEIRSDNGGQFASKLTQSFAVTNRIEWKRLPERAPWMGGFYEIMIKLVKRALIRATNGEEISDEELRTILTEIESTVNRRPLLYIGDEINDDIVTPESFLRPSTNGNGSPPTENGTDLGYGWKRMRAILRRFNDQWQHRYLTALRERYKTRIEQGRTTTDYVPRPGEYVQIRHGSQRRYWDKGKIVGLIRSNDGAIRSARIENDKGTIIKRAMADLFPLEIRNENNASSGVL